MRLVLWGEKVPATSGTVSDRFRERDGSPACDDLARLGLHGTGRLAGGTRQLGGELLGLLLCEVFERPSCEPSCGGGGDLLHLVEVHIEVGTARAIGALGDNFAPLLGEFSHCRQLLRR